MCAPKAIVAALVGAAAIALTGGLAAPAVAGEALAGEALAGGLASEATTGAFLSTVPEAVAGTTLPIGGAALDITAAGAAGTAAAAGAAVGGAQGAASLLPGVAPAGAETALGGSVLEKGGEASGLKAIDSATQPAKAALGGAGAKSILDGITAKDVLTTGAALLPAAALTLAPKPSGSAATAPADMPAVPAPPKSQAAQLPEQNVFKRMLGLINDPTALTGPGGIPKEKLLLGKATVLGA